MDYNILGNNFPVLEIKLEIGESIYAEAGTMDYINDGIELTTKCSSFVKAALFNQTWFKLYFTSKNRPGSVFLSKSFPGEIKVFRISEFETIICEKSSVIAYTEGVVINIKYNKVFSGLLSGEGIVMQQFSGRGLVFVHICGHLYEKDLKQGEKIIVDTGKVVAFDSTCLMTIKPIGNAKTIFTSGHGVFCTVLTGPGKVITQSMSINDFATILMSHIKKN